MRSVTVRQKALLGTLVALALLAGYLLLSAPKTSASMSQCPENSVCIWQNSGWTGEFSHWSASESGCHNHVKIPTFRSGWNRTNKNVIFGTRGSVPPGEAFSKTAGEPSIEGEVCW
jgi:hypothetical protein